MQVSIFRTDNFIHFYVDGNYTHVKVYPEWIVDCSRSSDIDLMLDWLTNEIKDQYDSALNFKNLRGKIKESILTWINYQ